MPQGLVAYTLPCLVCLPLAVLSLHSTLQQPSLSLTISHTHVTGPAQQAQDLITGVCKCV